MSFPGAAYDRSLDMPEERIRYCICGHDLDDMHMDDVDKDDVVRTVCVKQGCDCQNAVEDQGEI